MAQQEYQGAHALEFQAYRVNGAGCALTENDVAGARIRIPLKSAPPLAPGASRLTLKIALDAKLLGV
jgi:hypothetical protein